ncbi:TetR/AcrR family transcriptional regulator [Erysipelothrix aquatica]|uniref:TetR/AcrR family transcriptional regulator n=1 Tax=Erysipelothrix aquatica TaxID=2683714 RepID=UPI00135791EE|nr:TetR/AcrR family transcriptional regulator [Erysipelothrix aquatica]
MKIKSTEVRIMILVKSKQILEDGKFSSLTMRKIADSCEIGLGTIYRYFKNKDEILIELSREYWKKALESISSFDCINNTVQSEILQLYNDLYCKFELFDGYYIPELRNTSDESKRNGKNMESVLYASIEDLIKEIISFYGVYRGVNDDDLITSSKIVSDVFFSSIRRGCPSIKREIEFLSSNWITSDR